MPGSEIESSDQSAGDRADKSSDRTRDGQTSDASAGRGLDAAKSYGSGEQQGESAKLAPDQDSQKRLSDQGAGDHADKASDRVKETQPSAERAGRGLESAEPYRGGDKAGELEKLTPEQAVNRVRDAQDRVVDKGLKGRYREGVGGDGVTHCNQATKEVIKETLPNHEPKAVTANGIAKELKKESADPHGKWHEVSPKEAQRLANEGKTVVAAREADAQKGEVHGHVATVRPSHDPNEQGAPFISNVGKLETTNTDLPAHKSHNDFHYYAPR